jgi:hypothetical protein
MRALLIIAVFIACVAHIQAEPFGKLVTTDLSPAQKAVNNALASIFAKLAVANSAASFEIEPNKLKTQTSVDFEVGGKKFKCTGKNTFSNGLSWVGEVNGEGGSCAFTMQDGEISGSVNTDAHRYNFRSIGKGKAAGSVLVTLQTLVAGAFKAKEKKKDYAPLTATAKKILEAIKKGVGFVFGSIAKAISGVLKKRPLPTTPKTVRLVMFFGSDAVAFYKTGSRTETQAKALAKAAIRNAVAVINQGYARSKVMVSLLLVASEYIAVSDKGKTSTAILDLIEKGPTGKYKDMWAGVKKHKPDLFGLVTDKDLDACGEARRILAEKAEDAFLVVEPSCMTDNLSLGHELAHLFGCIHDIANDNTANNNHGLQMSSKYRTVMAYPKGSSKRINWFSDPKIKAFGVTTGKTGEAECANQHNEVVLDITKFSDKWKKP